MILWSKVILLMEIMLTSVKDATRKYQQWKESAWRSFQIISLSLWNDLNSIMKRWSSSKWMITASSLKTWISANIQDNILENSKVQRLLMKNKTNRTTITTTFSREWLCILDMQIAVTTIPSFKTETLPSGMSSTTQLWEISILTTFQKKPLEGSTEDIRQNKR